MKQVLPITLFVGAVITGIWWYGHTQYQEGQRDLLTEIEAARVKSIEEKQAIENEIDLLSDDALRDRALRWVRSR